MILYILDTKYFKRQSITYFCITAVCLLFGIIYEHFSHGVYSPFMMYAFLIPLVLGLFTSIICLYLKPGYLPNRISTNLYNAGCASITIYSIIRGVLEIYGTTNELIKIYLLITILTLLGSVINYIITLKFRRKRC